MKDYEEMFNDLQDEIKDIRYEIRSLVSHLKDCEIGMDTFIADIIAYYDNKL